MTVTKEKSLQGQCECCSKKNTKIQRRYKGEAYCPNCYRTWFIHMPCHKCGEIHRGHRKEEHSICRKCKINEPCVRCNKNAVKDGANTKYGRVCSSCYSGYFKPKSKCYECGEMKRNISRYLDLQVNGYDHRICTTCYGRFFHGTCKLCHRHRKLTQQSDGLNLCRKCSKNGLICCNTCHKLMPAGIGKHCWDCYWQKRLDKEVHLNKFLFRSELIKKDYEDFTKYFSNNRGAMVAKLKNNNFIEFFIRCDEIWGKVPSYQSLVEEFKPEGLRRNLTVLRWLINSRRIVENLEIKDRVAEEERILRLLEKLKPLPKTVHDYYQFSVKKQKERKTSLKTIRMNLQPVVDIYSIFELKDDDTPNQEQIDSYLLGKSGQYSSLYGFVTYLNHKHGMALACNQPNSAEVEKTNRKKLEKRLLDLGCKEKPLCIKDRLLWFQLSMVFFHKTYISIKELKAIELKDCTKDMVILQYNQQEFWIPTCD